MSSDEVKVKFVADTTGLQNVTVPNQIPASGGGASGGSGGGAVSGGSAAPGGSGNKNNGQNPPRGRDRASFPWEQGWSKEFGKDITSQFSSMLSGINLIGVAWDVAQMAAQKYVETVKLGIDYAQKIEKVSRTTGLSVEEVQKYGYAAQMSGVEFGTFANAMATANKELGKLTLYGGTSIVALAKLGINVDSVKNHSVGAIDVLKKMADAYKKHAETAEMAALGNQLFGGSFKDMIPMLRNGSAELEKLAEQAPKVNAQTISAAAATGRAMTGIQETVGANLAEDLSGYTRSEQQASFAASARVAGKDLKANEAVDKLLQPANRGATATITNSIGRLADYTLTALGQQGHANFGALTSGINAGEGIRGAGEDTKTVRERFIALRGGEKNLGESDKEIVAAFDQRIKEEGKMGLQGGVFQAASKMQQVGGGDVLSAISRVDLQEKIEGNTRRMADAMDNLLNKNPFGGGNNTPPPPDTNGPLAK